MGCDAGPGNLAIMNMSRQEREESLTDPRGVRYVDQLVEQLSVYGQPRISRVELTLEGTRFVRRGDIATFFRHGYRGDIQVGFTLHMVNQIMNARAQRFARRTGLSTSVAEPRLFDSKLWPKGWRNRSLDARSPDFFEALKDYGESPIGPGGPTLLLCVSEMRDAQFRVHARVEGGTLSLVVPDGQAAVEATEAVWVAEFKQELGL